MRDVPLHQLGLINPLDIAAWSSIARHREVRPSLSFVGGRLSGTEAIRWLFPQFTEDGKTDAVRSEFQLMCSGKWNFDELRAHCESIHGIPPEPPRDLNQDYDDPQGPIEIQGWLVSAELIAQDTIRNSVKVELWPSVRFYTGEGVTVPHLPAVMLAPYSHRNQPVQLTRLSELIESDTKLALIELLQDLDSDVRDLQIITEKHTGFPTILVKHNRSGSVPISVMGDGFRRALAIALSIPSASKGLLLIDEIETALHVSFLEKLFAWLIRACENFDVQLFATTHSLEAVSALVNVTPASFPEGIIAYYLDLHAPMKRYSSEMLARLVRDRGLDIR